MFQYHNLNIVSFFFCLTLTKTKMDLHNHLHYSRLRYVDEIRNTNVKLEANAKNAMTR